MSKKELETLNKALDINNKGQINLLRNTKSLYIIKEILSFLEENQRFKVTKYNKKYQELLEINIDNYKNISQKYKTGGINGEGKEYDKNFNILLFEGEYKNGKKNGKGKEYFNFYNDKISFEGEYLNGYKLNGKGYNLYGNKILEIDKNGIGKEYYDYGQLKFEGEFLNGIKWTGKGYDINGILQYELKNGNGYIKEYYNHINYLQFEGEYKHGKRYGKGIEYNFNGRLIFEGEYLNGKRYGKGKEYYFNGKIKFEGEYLNGKRWNGKGYDNKGNFQYELKNGKGYIKEYDYNSGSLLFEGEYLNGEKNGIGKLFYLSTNNSLAFEGEFKNGKRNGKGKEFNLDENLEFEGEYLNGLRWNGKAFNEDEKIKMELKNGKGFIKEYSYDRKITFECEFKNGGIYSIGKTYYHNGSLEYEGEHKVFLSTFDCKNGKGKEYYCNGQLKFEGEYINDKECTGKGYDIYGFLQ